MKSIIAGILCLLHYCFAQSQEPLSIGSTMPDLEIKNISNYSSSSVRISQLKGKAIVFYFWGVRCLSCIQSMPKLAELRKKFGDRLALFMVTEEADDVLQKFFDKRTYLKELKLPSIINQVILRTLFPLNGVPHVVWIGPDGMVKAITEGNMLTEANLLKLVFGDSLSLPVKYFRQPFDFKQLFVKGISNLDSLLLASSTFSFELPGVEPALRTVRMPDRVRLVIVNKSPLSMYEYVYHSEIQMGSSLDKRTRLILELDENSVDMKKLYCYEGFLRTSDNPETDRKKLDENARVDLDRFFNVKSSIEMRRLPCYFIETDSIILQHTDSSYIEASIDAILYNKQPVTSVINSIKYVYPFDRPVVTGANLGKSLTVLVKRKYEDLQLLKQDLGRYGIRLVEGETEMKILVIRKGRSD